LFISDCLSMTRIFPNPVYFCPGKSGTTPFIHKMTQDLRGVNRGLPDFSRSYP
jgi:hypothetical protein